MSGGIIMNKDILKGKWEQVKGKIQKEWGKLTDDDLQMIDGDEARLQGKLQEMYGLEKEEAQAKLDQILKNEE